MRLPKVIEDCLPDVNFKPLLIYCPIITDIAHCVVDSYLPVIENTSQVISFLPAGLIPPKTVLPAQPLRVLDIDPTQITTLIYKYLSIISI